MTNINTLFNQDPHRFETFSFLCEKVLIDFSKNPLTPTLLDDLIILAQKQNVPDALQKLNAGAVINFTENRAATHPALRHPDNHWADDFKEVIDTIRHAKNITDIINIGIGGSDLGPRMACEALKPYAVQPMPRFHFVSTLDAYQITEILKKLNPKNTMIIISSKSFLTPETLSNGEIAKQWLGDYFPEHAYAVTGNIHLAENFGLLPHHIFSIPDSIGGRYSIWSAIALPLMIQIGLNNFKLFLAGGHAVDNHVLNTPLTKNIPVLMALLNHWFINTLQAQTHAILPYDTRLSLFPAYLQQLEMESNGKLSPQNFQTGPIIWGAPETDGQHAFHQLLHQGTQYIPVDFIAVKKPAHTNLPNHQHLIANCFAQARALMTGCDHDNTIRYKNMPGNKPSTMILLPELNPFYLGFLIALYEYKVFVSAVIWNINPFDQWGVELGKKMATEIADYIKKSDTSIQLDTSTRGLIQWFSTDS